MAPKNRRTLVGRETKESVSESKKGKSFGSRIVDAAKSEGVEISKSPVESMTGEQQMQALTDYTGQGTLPGTEEALKPVVVFEGKMMCELLRPIYGTDKDGKFLELEFSFPIEAAHKPLLPKPVNQTLAFLDKKFAHGPISGINMSDQNIDIFLLMGDEEPALRLTGRPISKATIAIVEQTGTGTKTVQTRLLFRAKCEVENEVSRFADTHYNAKVWISISDIQDSMDFE
jgi:hypothetical protein